MGHPRCQVCYRTIREKQRRHARVCFESKGAPITAHGCARYEYILLNLCPVSRCSAATKMKGIAIPEKSSMLEHKGGDSS